MFFLFLLFVSLSYAIVVSQSDERRYFSQNGEDGILFKIFEQIGTTNKYYVEFGVQDGKERCTRALQEMQGWTGLLMDGSFENPLINLRKQYIKGEDIRGVFYKYNVPSVPDLVVIDIDSNDYWIWWALCASGQEDPSSISPEPLPFALESGLEPFRPRVVCIEYNAKWAPPDDRFVMYMKEKTVRFSPSEYFGASFSALVRLGKTLGYTLVYCDSKGVNMFFVRSNLLESELLMSPNLMYMSPGYNGGKGWTGPIPKGYHWLKK
jgi:hypothetical protein